MAELETKTYHIRVRYLWQDHTWSDDLENVPFDPAGKWAKENRICESFCKEMVEKNKRPNLVSALYLGTAPAGL